MNFQRFRAVSLAVCAAIGLAGITGGPASAHHSYAMFDLTRMVVLDATVQEFRWSNPHAFIRVSVPGTGGAEEVWSIEMTSPNNLIEDGWNRRTLRTGDKVRLYVHPLRTGARGGSYSGIRLPDGKTLGEIS